MKRKVKSESYWPELEIEKILCLKMDFPNISDEFERQMAELLKAFDVGSWELFSIEPLQPSPLPSIFPSSSSS
jgi:hypothetical protein